MPIIAGVNKEYENQGRSRKFCDTVFFLDWQNYVNVGAINCADQSNFETCVAFGIGAYPTIKVSCHPSTKIYLQRTSDFFLFQIRSCF